MRVGVIVSVDCNGSNEDLFQVFEVVMPEMVRNSAESDFNLQAAGTTPSGATFQIWIETIEEEEGETLQ